MRPNLYIMRMSPSRRHVAAAKSINRIVEPYSSSIGRIIRCRCWENTITNMGPKMRVLGSYAITYVLDGSGTYEDINGYKQTLCAGDLILVLPDVAHLYNSSSTGWTEFYIMFNGPVFDAWRTEELLGRANPIIHLQPIDYWLERMTNVIGVGCQNKTTTHGSAAAIGEVCRLQQLLADMLTSNAADRYSVNQSMWMSRACKMLESDLSKTIDLHDVATQLEMSYANFRRQFKKAIGMSPGRYRSLRKVDRACELMEQGQSPDKQIAEQLGFYDEFHFSKRFKQLTGQSPRAYRRTLL